MIVLRENFYEIEDKLHSLVAYMNDKFVNFLLAKKVTNEMFSYLFLSKIIDQGNNKPKMTY